MLVSYWENVFKTFPKCFQKFPSKVPKQQCTDVYWRKIGAIKNDYGQLKYPQLLSLAKFVLSISHENSVPETEGSLLTKIYLPYMETPLKMT